MGKTLISISELKDYLGKVDITVTSLAELSGVGATHLYKCMVGEVDGRNGAVRTMSAENMERLQEGLHQMSHILGSMRIYYDADTEICKRSGRRYCPDCVEQIKEKLSPYINILPFMQHTLGWNKSKVHNVMNITTSSSYGNITLDDCSRINNMLAEISATLHNYKIKKR